jgi:uncharacterized protein (DUF1501 family)
MTRSRTLRLDRRGFLVLGGAGAAALAFLPRPRLSRAAGPPPRARRLLVLHLQGGIRSSAAFLASRQVTYNPYGLIEGTGTPFALGRLLDDTPPGSPPLGDEHYTLGPAWGGARLPRLREVAQSFSVVGTWWEARGDHERARVEEATGSPDGSSPGLLTRVAAGLAAGGAEPAAPAFHLAPFAMFGAGAGELARYAPVGMESWASLPTASGDDPYAPARTGNGWVSGGAMAERIDRRRVESRGGVGRALCDAHAIHRRTARSIGRRLGEPDLRIADAGDVDAALGEVALDGGAAPLTNAMLYELTTRALGPQAEYEGDPTGSEHFDTAVNAALAVRLLQLGSPAVTLEIADFDLHSGERTAGPALYSMLGRLWASLGWLLARIPDPAGGTMLDSTLVVTTSDFGRDPAAPRGFNGGEGSDHGADPGCYYLAHALMGAGVRGGQLVGGVSTDDYDARREPLQIAPARLLATLLHALGIDPADPDLGFPDAGGPLEEVWS